MNKLLLVFGLIFILALSGCTSETPRGNITAPTGDSGVNAAVPAPSAVVKESYAIGEKATTKNGNEITLMRVVRIANCGDEGYCVGAYVKITNKGKEEVDADFSGSVILDDQGRQYEHGSFSLFSSCPNSFETTNLFPGASREGFVCFDGLKEGVSKIKIILSLGLFNSTKFVFSDIDPSMIETIDPMGEIEISSINASFTTSSYGGYGSISGVNYSLKNTGETYLSDLKYDYTIKRGELLIASGVDQSVPLYSLEPQKTNESSLSIFKTIEQGGEYTLNIVMKSAFGELARASKTFTVTATN